jgi:hypothetical protein
MGNQMLTTRRADSSFAGNFLIRVLRVLLRESAGLVLLAINSHLVLTSLRFNIVQLTAEPCCFTVNEWKRYASPLENFRP